jgi:hypothetical protein
VDGANFDAAYVTLRRETEEPGEVATLILVSLPNCPVVPRAKAKIEE